MDTRELLERWEAGEPVELVPPVLNDASSPGTSLPGLVVDTYTTNPMILVGPENRFEIPGTDA